MKRLSLIILCAGILFSSQAFSQSIQILGQGQTLPADQVLLRGLDTLNGTSQDLEVRVGETVRYGHLILAVDTCRVPRGDPAADAYVFLRIGDVREEEPRFSGWMFASSPALSALDHPRYDIWVESCSTS
ncbi:MAG: DUF2155 domain-containing protein [Pseudomonadota bacterium]